MKKRVLIVGLSICLFAAVAGFTISIVTRAALLDVFLCLTPTAPVLANTNILVLGVDSCDGHRSDTIMLLHLNGNEKKASVISIPRDTLLAIPGRGLDKINHAYAYGGIELTRKTVEDFFKVSVPYYIIVNFAGIEHIIDQLGGVTVNVEKRMYYVDYAGDLTIDLQPGLQHLNGQQAMGYLRFRHSDNDFARIGRQQKFLQSIANEMMSRDNIVKSPKLFFSLLACLDTNLNSRQVLGLALLLRGANELNQISMTMVQGEDLMVDNIYYLRPKEEMVRQIVDEFITPKGLAAARSGS